MPTPVENPARPGHTTIEVIKKPATAEARLSPSKRETTVSSRLEKVKPLQKQLQCITHYEDIKHKKNLAALTDLDFQTRKLLRSILMISNII